jgi:hypothetical protein
MDLMRLVPGREPSAGEKIEEQIDNLCPSLTWTQRMIGFGITAGEASFLARRAQFLNLQSVCV